MNHHDDIIDVTPVDQTSAQGTPSQEQPPAQPTGSKKPYYTFDGTSWHPGNQSAPPQANASSAMPVDARVLDGTEKPSDTQPKSRLGGVARIAAGGVCTLVGIPMLILPGPGLVAIGGGIYLMASGAKRAFGK